MTSAGCGLEPSRFWIQVKISTLILKVSGTFLYYFRKAGSCMAIGMVNTLHLLHELQGELFYIIKLLGLCVMTKYSSRFNLGCWSMPRTLVSLSGVNPEMSSRFDQCPFLKLWRISLWRPFARQGQIFPRTNGMYSLCIWTESVTST